MKVFDGKFLSREKCQIDGLSHEHNTCHMSPMDPLAVDLRVIANSREDDSCHMSPMDPTAVDLRVIANSREDDP